MGLHATYVGHRPNRVEIQRVFRGPGGPVDREVYGRMGLLVLNDARHRVGVRSGRLISTLHRERGVNPRGIYVDIVAGTPGITTYLGYHHDGTPPHTITARRRKVLRFIWHGRVVYARQVHHPGTRGTQFLVRALDVLR